MNRDVQEMLGEVVEKLVDAQFQPKVRVQITGRMPNGVDSHQLLADGVAAVMKKNLSAEQWARYEPEKLKRDENRKSTTIRYFVDAIDRELYLSPRQCEQLAALLKQNWEPAWSMYLENHLFGNKYYPITIDPLVTPLLSDAQKKVWGGVQKVGVYWGFAGMLAGFVNDRDGLEIELGEPARPDQVAKKGVGAAKVRAPAMKGVMVETREARLTSAQRGLCARPCRSLGTLCRKARKPLSECRIKRSPQVELMKRRRSVRGCRSVWTRDQFMIAIDRQIRRLFLLIALFVAMSAGRAAFGQDDDLVDDAIPPPQVMMPAQVIVRQAQFNPEQIDQWVFSRWGVRGGPGRGWRRTLSCGSMISSGPARSARCRRKSSSLPGWVISSVTMTASRR